MILKASQRGGARQLAAHLLRTDDNEHVEVHEVRGFVSQDLAGALTESYAISRGTRCKQHLFSLSLNPPQTEAVGVETFENALERIEDKVGLTDQPRVIVFHEKEGRRHAHCVWSRIDAETMTARNLSHFKLKLRDVSRELYLENDWEMPRGLMNSKARDPRNYTLAEYQQAKRLGESARDLKSVIHECWAVSDTRATFEHALGERGIILAKGDTRGHVAVTDRGMVLAVARCTGKKAKEVRARLGEPDGLPSVDEAKSRMARDMTRAFNRHVDEARSRFGQEMAPLDSHRRAMTADHQGERTRLDTAQKERWAQESRERQERFNKGFRGIWDRITGQHTRVRRENEAQALAAIRRDRAQRDALVGAQLEERRKLQTEINQAREAQAQLLAELRRDKRRYREMAKAAPESAGPKAAPAKDSPKVDWDSKNMPPQVTDRFERVAALKNSQPQRYSAPREQEATPQPATPSPEDRLANLRNTESRQASTPKQERDREP